METAIGYRLNRSLVLLFFVCLSSCGGESATQPTDPGATETPEALVAAYGDAISSRDLATFASLLDPAFEYFPTPTLLNSLRWIDGPAWGTEDELNMLGHMADAEFVSPRNGHSVSSMTLQLVILGQEQVGAGVREVTCQSNATVLWEPGVGETAETVQVIGMREDQGDFRIAYVRERPALLRQPSAEAGSWGTMKEAFRLWPAPTNAQVEDVVAAHGAALAAADSAGYCATLAPAFAYFPTPIDVADFPWMSGTSWDRAEELAMVGHLMDSTFVSVVSGKSVRSLEVLFSESNIQDLSDGTKNLVCRAFFAVRWTDDSGGFDSDVGLRLRVGRVEGGGHQILSSVETDTPVRHLRRDVEFVSWANVKALFR